MIVKFSIRSIHQGQSLKIDSVAAGAGQIGQALVLKAGAGVRYQLSDIFTLTAPGKLKMKRLGQDLTLSLPGGDIEMPDVVIKDYFSFSDVSLMGQSGAGQWMLYDTSELATGVVLSGAAPIDAVIVALESAPGSSWFDGGLGLGTLVAGGLGLAALVGGGGSDDDATLAATKAAINKIADYKNDTSNPAPSVSDYMDAGVTGITSGNRSVINAIIAASPLKLDTSENIQKAVNSFLKISAEANGAAEDLTPSADPTVTDYDNIGVILNLAARKADILALLNDVLKNTTLSGADSLEEIRSLAAAVEKLALIAEGRVATLLATDLTTLGIDTIAANLAAIANAIKNSDDGGSAINTVAKVKAMVNAYNKILAEANGSSEDATPDANPTASDYAAIGANIGVAANESDAGRAALARLNAIIQNLDESSVDTVAEIERIASTLDKILTVAESIETGALDAAHKFSAKELNNLGLSGFSLTNGVTSRMLDDLATEVSKAIRSKEPGDVVAGALTGTKLDTTGAKTEIDQTQLERLQALVSLEIIKNYVVDTTVPASTTVAPTLADWKAAGIFKDHPTDAGKFVEIEIADLDYLNSAVDKLTATQISSTGLQAVVNSYVKIIREANGSAADADTTSNPEATDYANIGVIGKVVNTSAADHANALKLLNDIVALRSSGDVDTVKEVQAFADLVEKIYNLAALEGSATLTTAQTLTVAELTSLGLTGFTSGIANNNALAVKVSEAIRDKDPANFLTGKGTKLDTTGNITEINQTQLERLQSLVSLEIIKNYVVDTTVPANTTVAPTLADWKAAGIFKDHPTDAGKFAEIQSTDVAYLNSAVDKLTAVQITTIGLQAVVNSYVKIIREANGSAADATPGADPIASDFVNIGVVADEAALTAFQISFLSTLIGEKSSTQVDSILKIQNLLPTIASLWELAAKDDITSTTAPDAGDKTALSVTRLTNDLSLRGVNDHNHDDVLRAIQNADNTGVTVDTFAELQSLVSLTRILRYSDSSSTTNNPAGEPTFLDWMSIVGLNNESEANFRAYNSVVDAYDQAGLSTLGGSQDKELGGLQRIVNSFNIILAEADGDKLVDQTIANPKIEDYQNLKLSFSSWTNLLGDSEKSDAFHLLNNAVGGMTTDKVDSFGELEAIANAAGRVILQAQAADDAITNTTGKPSGNLSTTAGLSKSDLTLLGLDTSRIGNGVGVNDANEFSNILAEIQNLSPSDAFNLATLQNKIDIWAQS